MRRLALPLILPLLLAAAPVRQQQRDQAVAIAGQAVALALRPGTQADAAARRLVAEDLAEARRAGEAPLVLTANVGLGKPRDPTVLFVQLQSPRECGSAGCSTSAFQPHDGTWRKVLDAVSGPITITTGSHNGMRDLMAGDTRFFWNGTAYSDAKPAPAVDLRRRR